jgi:uroporphyrinogen-III synthase
VALGKKTAAEMGKEGLRVDAVSEHPSPEAVLAAIESCQRDADSKESSLK